MSAKRDLLHSFSAAPLRSSQLTNPGMLENTANIFSDGLQRQPLLTSQENFGSESQMHFKHGKWMYDMLV